jgi:hypothetical protein
MKSRINAATNTADFFKAIAAGDKDAVAAFVDSGVSPDQSDKNGVAPLILAAFLNHADVVDLLASRGATYPRFVWIEHLSEYGEPKNFGEFRRRYNPIVEATQAAILHQNTVMFERLLSLHGAERALLKKSGLQAWSQAHSADESRHVWLGPMCAKIIGTRIDLAGHDPGRLKNSLVAFYKGMNTCYHDRVEDVPKWKADHFGANRSGVVSLPFRFFAVMADLDREYVSRIKTNDSRDSTGTHLEWQPDEYTYVVGAQKEDAPSDDGNDTDFAWLTGRLIYSSNSSTIAKIATMLTSIREDSVEHFCAHIADGLDPYCGAGAADDIAQYAIVHGAARVLGHLVEQDAALRSSSALNALWKAAERLARFASSADDELRNAEPDDPDGVSFLSDLECGRTRRVLEELVTAANRCGTWLDLWDSGRFLIEGVVEEQRPEDSELMTQLFRHISAAPGLMEKFEKTNPQISSMARAWVAREAVDRVLQAARPAAPQA